MQSTATAKSRAPDWRGDLGPAGLHQSPPLASGDRMEADESRQEPLRVNGVTRMRSPAHETFFEPAHSLDRVAGVILPSAPAAGSQVKTQRRLPSWRTFAGLAATSHRKQTENELVWRGQLGPERTPQFCPGGFSGSTAST